MIESEITDFPKHSIGACKTLGLAQGSRIAINCTLPKVARDLIAAKEPRAVATFQAIDRQQAAVLKRIKSGVGHLDNPR